MSMLTLELKNTLNEKEGSHQHQVTPEQVSRASPKPCHHYTPTKSNLSSRQERKKPSLNWCLFCEQTV